MVVSERPWLWQTLLLSRWRPILEWLPVES